MVKVKAPAPAPATEQERRTATAGTWASNPKVGVRFLPLHVIVMKIGGWGMDSPPPDREYDYDQKTRQISAILKSNGKVSYDKVGALPDGLECDYVTFDDGDNTSWIVGDLEAITELRRRRNNLIEAHSALWDLLKA